MFLFKDKVSNTRLLVDFIHQSVELFEELFLLDFEILELLQSNLILPLDLLGGRVILGDALSSSSQLVHDFVVLFLL